MPFYSDNKTNAQGRNEGMSKAHSGFVDVRDVADLHLKALSMPEANGQRFITVAGEALSMVEGAAVLRRNLGKSADKAPAKELPLFRDGWILKNLCRKTISLMSIWSVKKEFGILASNL